MTERLEIEIAPDQMGASVRVVPGEAVTPEQLTEALTKAGIVFGVSEPAIAELAKNLCSPLFESEAVVVARGQPPRDQSAEGFEALFAVGIRGGHRDRDGSFDFRDRELLKAVHVGDAIARVNPPVTGVSGRSVTGRELPYAVRETSKVPSFGPGVARQPGGAVVAARDGIIVYTEGDVLDVVDLYVHEGDVDIHSGNLNMRGSLTVGGDVAAKFEVQATGDVEIKKSVLGGSVYSA